MKSSLGISGRIAKNFLTTEITPLLALAGLLLGLFAVFITPREEEPQINVTFANVFIPYPGASAKEVESTVTTPAEQIVAEISGVEHIYSASSPGMAILTVQFKVGEPRTDAIVRLYNAFYSNGDWQPHNNGVGTPLIKPQGIDDVPIVAGTLWSQSDSISAMELTQIANTIATELQRVPGTRDITVIGNSQRIVAVELDPIRMAGFNIALSDLRQVLHSANASSAAGALVNNNHSVLVEAGSFLTSAEEIAELVIAVRDNAPIFLADIATVKLTAAQANQYVSFAKGAAAKAHPGQHFAAVTIAVSKKPGENAVQVAEAVIARFENMRGIVFPDGIEATVTRNYGATAADKAQTLIKKLIFATLSVVILVLFALGRKEALVVGIAVIVTLAITLFASWAWGFTLNRVSLFALIFSIGILVDDAIVVVENIHRHMAMGKTNLTEAIPAAVDEVGGPTILATFTVIAALLPMAFVSGLMGPYMLPIPINASTGMLISLAVAFMFTPWLYRKLFIKQIVGHDSPQQHNTTSLNMFTQLMSPFLNGAQGGKRRWLLLLVLIGLITGSIGLVVNQNVILKMLPFDNKSEFQILVDLPEGSALERTQETLVALTEVLHEIPEVVNYQMYAGTSAPINFNGLVRQYYLRKQPNQGDIQVNLLDKHERNRKSHEIASTIRQQLSDIGKRYGAVVKIIEVPPGPPVLAPLVAEIYGLDYRQQQITADHIAQQFALAQEVVEVDTSIEIPQEKWLVAVDRTRAARLGVTQSTITSAISAALSGEDMGYLHDEQAKNSVPIRVQLPANKLFEKEQLQALQVRSANGNLVPLSEVTQWHLSTKQQTIYHKNLLPVVYVTADVSGPIDSPLYALGEIKHALQQDNSGVVQLFLKQPDNPYSPSLKWDGEWQVTYETFRDMGAAYAVGLILIYLLVVAQFRSYGLPLIIMAPIPLTMIGIMPGHAILGQQFTAPSMIGMIALAGIIVRNSILLVDFIQQEVTLGKNLQQATIEAAAIRAKPIVLTALAAMMGGFFILDDPIFGGLAVSLIFGLLVSTILTLLVIPIVYYHYNWAKCKLNHEMTK